MSTQLIADLLEGFDVTEIEAPLTHGDISSFECRTNCTVPPLIKELLLEANGLEFTNEVRFGEREIWCIQYLQSIENTILTYRSFIPPSFFPFVKSNGDELISVSSENRVVYSITGYSESQREIHTQLISPAITDFIAGFSENRKIG